MARARDFRFRIRVDREVLAFRRETVPRVGVVRVTRLIYIFLTLNISSRQVVGVLVWSTNLPTTVERVVAECTTLLYVGRL